MPSTGRFKGGAMGRGAETPTTTVPAPGGFTSRALVPADDGATLICATAQSATVNSGMPTRFGVAVKGPISWVAGSGVAINDVRTTGAANPWCALVQTGPNSYDVVGGRG